MHGGDRGRQHYTPELIEGLICRRERLPLRELRLMDIDARKNEIVGNFAERMLRAAGIAAKVVRTEDLRAALEGVDFAVAQVRVGGWLPGGWTIEFP